MNSGEGTMQIAGIQKLTLLDFPGRCAATIFTPGCNLRCPFCHNAPLVEEEGIAVKSDGSNMEGLVSEEWLLDFLSGRFGRLTGLAVTGGEPLMQQGIKELFIKVRALGFGIKLDTNGTYPEKLKELLDLGLVDYVAMDVKNSWASYPKTIGIEEDKAQILISKIKESMDILKEHKAHNPSFDFEFRSTIVKELHTAEDIEEMAKAVGPVGHYFLQGFKDSGEVLRTGYSAHSNDTMKVLLEIAKKYSPGVQLRGID